MDFLVDYGSYVLVPIHVIVCFILIAVVLLQHGKGTDWAGVFGGAGSQTAFGPRGVENTLSRLTKIAAVIFMLTSFSISLLQSRGRSGAFEKLDLPSAATKKPAATASPVAGTSGAAALPAAEETPATTAPAPSPSTGP